MPEDHILGDYSNGVCYTKRELFRRKNWPSLHTTANLTMLPPTQEDSLQLTELGLRSLDGTIQVCGSGEQRTLSFPLKFGCVVVDQSGSRVVACHTCIEVTPVVLVTVVHWQ